MEIQILDPRLHGDKLPQVHTAGSAGIDLRASINVGVLIAPGNTVMLGSGIKVAIPVGYVGLLIPRSSTGIRGVHLANVVGVIDSDYRGEIKLPIKNVTPGPMQIDPMERIAQLVVLSHLDYSTIKFVDALDETERGEGGFGHTGSD